MNADLDQAMAVLEERSAPRPPAAALSGTS